MSYLAKEKVVSRNNPSIFPQETIYKNYFRIQLKPEQFSSYLTSPEVGFSSYELVATPSNTSRGKHGWEGLVLDARVLRCGEPQGPTHLPLSSLQASSVQCTCSTRLGPPATKWPSDREVVERLPLLLLRSWGKRKLSQGLSCLIPNSFSFSWICKESFS